MKVNLRVCIKCPLLTTKLLGVETGINRCSVCHCIIKLKAAAGGNCPKFNLVKDMVSFKKSLTKNDK